MASFSHMSEVARATPYFIYPNVPKAADWGRIQRAVKKARTGRSPLGIWSDRTFLPAYKYRYCFDTAAGKREGPDKYCVDVATVKLHQPQDYFRIPPENRLFVKTDDVGRLWSGSG